ncbi:MAG: hypothetical protein JWN78_645 [Bacteroidota bacterium]|nr:hypothetical protein [Bacteroidota bacterium]
MTYLKEIDNYQKDRRITIENKNSQLVGQASIVVSIFSLFIPLLFDTFNGIALCFKIPLTIIFLFILFHYLLSIFHAIKTLKIDRYKYATRKTSTITKNKRANNELEFLNEEINDLIYTVNQTAPIDNIKGENLILGARCFEIANFGFGFFTILIILTTFLVKRETPKVQISNFRDLHDSISDTFNTRITHLNVTDTLIIQKDSLNNKIILVSK